jgi:hypothetical protein
MRRTVSVLACGVLIASGCTHLMTRTPEERMLELLYQSDESGPPDATKVPPGQSHTTPERIHGGII